MLNEQLVMPFFVLISFKMLATNTRASGTHFNWPIDGGISYILYSALSALSHSVAHPRQWDIILWLGPFLAV